MKPIATYPTLLYIALSATCRPASAHADVQTPKWKWTGELPNPILNAFLKTALETNAYRDALLGNRMPFAGSDDECAVAMRLIASLRVPGLGGRNLTVEFHEMLDIDGFDTTLVACVLNRSSSGLPHLKKREIGETRQWDKVYGSPKVYQDRSHPAAPVSNRLEAWSGNVEQHFEGTWYSVGMRGDVDRRPSGRIHVSIDVLSPREAKKFRHAGELGTGKRYEDYQEPLMNGLLTFGETRNPAEVVRFVHETFVALVRERSPAWTPRTVTLVITVLDEDQSIDGPLSARQHWIEIPSSASSHPRYILRDGPVETRKSFDEERAQYIDTTGTILSPFRFQRLQMQVIAFKYRHTHQRYCAGVRI